MIFAALSDLVDGVLSRRLHATSAAGRLIDPIADKVFVFAVVLTLLLDDRLALWEIAVVVLRDIAVVLVTIWLLIRSGWRSARQAQPSLLGKGATVMQFAFLVVTLILDRSSLAVLLPTAIVSGLAGLDYVRRHLTQRGLRSPDPTG